jgi:hypothetical protein
VFEAEWVWAPCDRLIVVGEASGRRYVFTRQNRVQPIDESDVEQFESRVVEQRACGRCGGKRRETAPETNKVFEIRRT